MDAFNPAEGQAKSTKTDEDLSGQIIATVERQPADIVRCTRVNGNFYRCNWWSIAEEDQYDNPSMKGGQVGTTHRIRKSQFLDVRRSEAGINIQVIRDPSRR